MPINPNQNSLFQKIEQVRRRQGKVRDTHINLSHGSGGKAMRDLIDDIFVKSFDNPILAQLEDQATFDLASLSQHGKRLAFTTDSYVVDPLFFPGSDIGELAINGTINDLAVSGAKPLYLTCSVILEEGLPVETLRRVVASMQKAAQKAGVQIVTGDTKVVNRGCADKLFINTAGIGIIPPNIDISPRNIQPGDVVIINGEIGNHGAAILIARGELALETDIESDCQPLHELVAEIIKVCPQIHAMRDVTRGGLATVLNEFALTANVGIRINENAIPIREEVNGICEILGLEPLYLANEGKLVIIAPAEKADLILETMRNHPTGKDASIIGEIIPTPSGIVLLKTAFGAERIIDMLVGDQLPRIC
ncbi:hydrogenase expression/formation protein HypE [Aphanizomenon sp. PH219]|uniref:Hydrogenase expression/formation protein HypE n=1 Tax=Dolichospermum heterosporum TAC447 TaxID=747523 RepID=A0ABY5LVJ6_9CYAN|nr:hydrogenase expression/formation protein HypE [Dolichospermum heterosporum]MDK2409151.1 hydrogenase expression/formation protein HypE [Aphanizomenon sp. 202]MDK2458684.1 hydrogenase expression/formation protein HypE [Aphanizomenon sp. PH219]UUO14777.1 hydrogenase expression/formation protein HypE [Dolichospermum heterosporum TAC447]